MRTLDDALNAPTLLARTDAFVGSPRATLRPESDPSTTLALRSAPPPDVADIAQRVRMESVLGEGGMGIVRLGEQLSLERKVAVKTVRGLGAVDTRAARKLLEEAWVTGSLEHPNIVPVHDLYVDRDGRPHIVLKRIEGKPLADVLQGESSLGEAERADALDRNLGVLIQVCHAVAFAHQRGIVHRDLKPDNVMIGEFGEVIVLDWGIALTTRDDNRRIPHVSTATQAAGTPAYMAPEMLGGKTSRVGPWTDVYLLGAMLYELVTGDAPHQGASFDEVMRCIVRSQPPLHDHVPQELQRIIRRAMDPDPEGRFDNVVQLRMALSAFVRNQGSRRLVAAAEPQRAALLAGMAQIGNADDPDAQARLHGLFSACRFAYAEALRAWPGNEDAATALREMTEAMVEHQLALGQPRVAAASLAGLSNPPAALRARVDAAVRTHDAEHHSLQALARERDLSTGARTRAVVALMLGVVWSTVPWAMLRVGFSEARTLILAPALFLVVGLGILIWAYDSLTKTAINRFLSGSVAFALGFQLLFAWAAPALGVPVIAILPLTFLIWGMCAAHVALNIDPRLYAMLLVYLVGFAVAFTTPDLRWIAGSACNVAGVLIAFALWVPRGFLNSPRA